MISTATRRVVGTALPARGERELRKPLQYVEDETSDDVLIQEVLSGNEAAFDPLVLRYRQRVIKLVWRFFPNHSDAEDMAQEALVRAYINLEKLKEGVPFQNWLIRIAANLCLDRLRKEKRAPYQVTPDMEVMEADWLDCQAYAKEIGREVRFENSLIAQQLVTRGLDRLVPRDRLVLHLLYTEGRSVAEVASTMGWTKSNVKVRAFRARRILRKFLKEIGVFNSG
jgi:RNA polymerase sigma-70 factor (ECF subfamily)